MLLPALLPLALGTLGVIAGQLDPSVELWTEPAVLVVERGGSVQVKLRVNCSGSEPSALGIPDLETYMQKEEVSRQPGEKVLRLVKVTEWNSTSLIYYTCPNSKRTVKTIPVIVYSIPAPELSSSRPDTWDLACSVSGTAPLGNVTVTLRSGSDVLASKTIEVRGRTQPDTVQLRHQWPVRPEDDGKNVTCEALLDVSPHGSPVKITSEPLVLDLTALPKGPLLSLPPRPVELGTPFNATCTVRPGVPAANFAITADNRTFPLTLGQGGHRAVATVTLNRTGNIRLVCTVGGKENGTSAQILVYHVPTPVLNVNTSTPAPGAVVSGVCKLPLGTPGDIDLRVLSGNRTLQGWGRTPVDFTVAVGNDTELSCQARLWETVRSNSIRIRVQTKPQLDSAGCPGRQNWTEGQEGTLECRAQGRPKPKVECSKDGNSIPPGIPRPADRAHAGTYRCRATNALGTAERNVTVWVQYDDPVPLLPVLLGVLVPVAALLALAGLYAHHHHRTKIGEYWLWKRQPHVDMRPLRPPGGSKAASTPNGSAAKAL